MKAVARFAVGALLVLLTASCGSRFKMAREEMPIRKSWPVAQGETNRLGRSNSTHFSGHLELIWETGSSGKPVATPTIYGNFLIYPETKKKIRFYDLATGDYLGRIKTKGITQSVDHART